MEAIERTPESPEEVLQREREAFDARASGRDAAKMPPRESHPGISLYEDTILETIGDVRGLRILDLCCGQGDLSLRLLARGGQVTAIDVSPKMVDLARRRAAIHLPEANGSFVVGQAEHTGLEPGSFDWVVGAFALHHLDLDRAATEVNRLLRPGGRAVFIETSALSPPLSLFRNHVVGHFGIPRVSTDDERPFDLGDVALLRSRFDGCVLDFPDFVFFGLISRHIRQLQRTGPSLRRLDSWIERRFPRACRWSYAMRIQLARSEVPSDPTGRRDPN